jgi:hypothetical protein
MYLPGAVLAIAVGLAGVAWAGQRPGAEQMPVWHAHLASGPITLDGKLNEAAWQQAEAVELTQQSPKPGQRMPYRTEVRVLEYKDALYFGFRCWDPNPKAIATHTLARDGSMVGDDSLSIVLDSFGDKLTGYFFQINEAAARADGLISGPGNVSFEWDGIWNAKTARTADGWTAEIEIPAQTLNFGAAGSRWGVEIDRFVARDQTELRWASPLLDADLMDMSRTGDLVLESPLKQGHGLEIAPYLRGTKLRDFTQPESNWLSATGGELTWRLTPQLAGVLTVNTDFAETEVDARQVNTTPFPLYYPEKRAFFLEGANQYTFGLDLGQTFVPYYSRNIGLLDGYDLPLDGGVKLNGRVGKLSIGLTDAQTRTAWVPQIVQEVLGLPSAEVKGTNLLASRVAYDVDKNLRVGAMVTHGDPEVMTSNTLAGADAVWHTSEFMGRHTLELGGWGATTQGNVPLGSREAWGYRVDYPNDLVNCAGGENHFGDGFSPLLGFIPRPATNQYTANCSYRPRPSPTGSFRAIRQASYDLNYVRVTDTAGNLQSEELDVNPIHLTMNSGDSLTAGAILRHETLTTPFAIVPTVAYPDGQYDFARLSMNYYTSLNRPFYAVGQTYAGRYYGGNMLHQYVGFGWSPLRGRAQMNVATDNYFGHTPQGNFVEKLWQFNGALFWSPNLSASTFVQYDNISFDLSSNTRLRWTIKPGNDFYVIWDRTWLRNATSPGLNLGPSSESLTMKLQWTFRL